MKPENSWAVQGTRCCSQLRSLPLCHRGRTASCPTAPSQIPACGTTAPGFSKSFALHTACLEVMTNAWFRQFEIVEQRIETLLVVAFPLAAPVEPLEQNDFDLIKIIAHSVAVASDTVIIPVSPQL